MSSYQPVPDTSPHAVVVPVFKKKRSNRGAYAIAAFLAIAAVVVVAAVAGV